MVEKTKPGALICAAAKIFDQKKVDKEIAAIFAEGGQTDQKAALVAIMSEVWADGHRAVSDAFLASPYSARRAIMSYTYLAERVVACVVEAIQSKMYPLVSPTASERIAVMFVGGSGRREMAPYSDIDLLFLSPYKKTAWTENVIETALYVLWDLNLKVGYSVRSIDDCLAQAREDITIRTNLLEARFLTGDEELADDMESRLWKELFSKTGPEFVEAKLDERALRHRKNGGSRYLVEPNVKEGKGGLRDMQTLYWIAKYLYGTKSVDELVKKKVFLRREHREFDDAEAFLWTTRCMMHLLAGRATEKLTFDLQVEVADKLGFSDEPGRRAVEKFMQQYFTHAKQVGELTRVFLVQLEDQHVKQRPGIGTRVRAALKLRRTKLSSGFVNKNGRLSIEHPKSFFSDKLNILRLFEEALRSGLLLHPEAMRAVTSKLGMIDDEMRNSEEANEIFLRLLLSNSNPERALRRMNELGVLGAFMPEFQNIVSMMQFNMYHSYTVDEHTIQCISILNQIEKLELEEDLPVASSILEAGVNRRILYLAVLLHDIGKGRPEDHSVIGAEIARQICTRMGLPNEEVEAVVWLVRNHLVMSDYAQKRDITDIRTVRDFAGEVRTKANLNLLTVLTVCDIRGVGPDTWNNWKAVLLRELYALALDELTEGGEALSSARLARIEDAKKQFARRVRGLEGKALEAEINRHYEPFWLGRDIKTQLILSKLSRDVSGTEIAQDIQMDKSRDATRACFAMADHPGLFARFTGALALAGANIKDARTYTTSDGIANSVFWIQDNQGQPYEKARLGRLRKIIDEILNGTKKAGEALANRNITKARARAFTVPTTINIDNEASEIFTIIEVDTRDRPGLLYDLSRTMTAMNLSISSAIIATYGNQAVDTFYVKDLFGLKIHDRSKHKRIEERLREAIALPGDPEKNAA